MRTIARTLASGAVVVAVGGVFAIGAQAQDAPEKVRWKMHSAFPKATAVIGPPPHRIADAVARMSAGNFDIKVFEPNALAGGHEYFEPVAKGTIDAAFGTPSAHQATNSAFAFLSTWPFGPAAPEFMAWMIHGGGAELAAELYAGQSIKYLLCGMTPPESAGWFVEEITDLDQLSGMKMRFFGAGAKVMSKLGVTTQPLPAADIYTAFKGNQIGGSEVSMPAIDALLKIHEVAKFNYFPGWHQQTSSNELLVNMKAWDALPEAYQIMLETACRANIADMVAEGEASQFGPMIENEKQGVKNLSWSAEQLERFRSAWDEVLADELGNNDDAKRVWDSFTAFHERYKTWGDRGYLK